MWPNGQVMLVFTKDIGRMRDMVGATGFEPATPCSQSRCATKLRYAPTAKRREELKRRDIKKPPGVDGKP